MVQASPALSGTFAALAILLALGFVLGVRHAWRRTSSDAGSVRRATLAAAVAAGVWMAGLGAAAAAGRLSFTTTPPTMPLVIVGVGVIGLSVGLSRVGARLAAGLPLALLVGFQGFRLPLELMMHRAAEIGLMPPQMSYSGLNFDIVTGVTALIAGGLLAAGRLPRWTVHAWNTMGALLLLNVVTVAMLSAPGPLRVFRNEPANVWISAFPWVWLPGVYVTLAVIGHVVVFRRLRMDAAAQREGRPALHHAEGARRAVAAGR